MRSPRVGIAVPFPDVQPPGYEWLDDEPVFDAGRHLQIEEPTEILLLADLGYDEEEIATKATPVAASSPFRLLSDEGAAIMLDVARRLRRFGAAAGDRIETMVRGGCYRSQWLRDLCLSQDVSAHLEKIYGIEIAPHPMPVHLGHLNFEPSRIEKAIDKWHHDTLPLDFVMTVTDPMLVAGGRFEYFLGTRHEAAELAAAGATPPPDRTVAPDFPGPGYAIALHGDMVVHRAGPLSELTERISMVNGYVALDTSRDEQSRSADLMLVDDPNTLYAEWAKFAAWRSRGRLGSLLDELASPTTRRPSPPRSRRRWLTLPRPRLRCARARRGSSTTAADDDPPPLAPPPPGGEASATRHRALPQSFIPRRARQYLERRRGSPHPRRSEAAPPGVRHPRAPAGGSKDLRRRRCGAGG